MYVSNQSNQDIFFLMNNKSSAFYFVSMNAYFNAKLDAVYTLALDNVQYYALV